MNVLKLSFVRELAKTGVLGDTFKKVNITRGQYYKWCAEVEFKNACDIARETAIDEAELVLRNRALYGDTSLAFYRGKPVWTYDPSTNEPARDIDGDLIQHTVVKHCDKLLEFYIKANRARYKDSYKLDVSGLPSKIDIGFVKTDDDGNRV